jgi:hypothetical protein
MDRILRSGDTGSEVRTLTALLIEREFLDNEKSTFDREVKRAVKDFQSRHIDPRGQPLIVDGVVGPLTWWALRHPDNTTILLGSPATMGAVRVGASLAGNAALQAAHLEIQAQAREIGMNNAGPWVEKYLNGIVPPPANWCAGFVSWCYTHAPGGIPFRYSLGARDIRDQFRRRGWLYDPSDQTPEPGDIVVWWREQRDSWKGHIGLVDHFSDGILYTIEGNKGGFPAPVKQFNYVGSRIDKLLGYGRVP